MSEPPLSEAQEQTQVTMSGDTRVAEESAGAGTSPEALARIGRFAILRKVGQGGMGVVHAGYDEQLDRKVAIKLLRHRTHHATRRLAREAQALAKLSHPNVVQIYEIGQHEGGAFIAMEFVEGQTLGVWRRARARTWRELLAVMLDAGRGLAAAHQKGLVHRDFKPDNVMLDAEGRVRVMDFGLVHGALAPDRALDESAGSGDFDERESDDVLDVEPSSSHASRDELSQPLTMAGSTLGTPAYMPPEQHLGLPTDARSDQFSFCVALWELLYGQRPFTGDNLAALCLAVTTHELREPPRDAEVPAWLRKVVERGLALDPRERWPDMDALLKALADDPRRRRGLSLATAALLLTALAGFGLRDVKLERERARTLAACEAEAATIDEVWNDAIAAELEAKFAKVNASIATESWSRTRPQLAAYAEAWAVARSQSCRAAELEQTLEADDYLRARACLDDARLAFAASVEVLREPNRELVAYAARLPHKLPHVEACSDRASLARRAPSSGSSEAATLRASLLRAQALERVGGYEESRALAEQIIADATRLEDPAIAAEARLLVGDVHDMLGDYVAARSEYERAFRLAAENQADELALRATSRLVIEVGTRLGEIGLGRLWGEFGTMLVARLDERGVDAAGLHTAIASLERNDSNYEIALASAKLSLELYTDNLGERHPDLAEPLLAVASVHRSREEFDEALALARRALGLREQALGPRHPDVANTLDALGRIHDVRGEFELARDFAEQALAIREQAFGDSHPDVASSLVSLALLDIDGGRNSEALPALVRALEIFEHTLGHAHERVARTADNIALVHYRLGNIEDALAYNRRALETHERVFGPEHERVADSLTSTAQFLVEEDRFDEAEAAAARALAIYEVELGPEHTAVAIAILGIGSVVEARGDLRGALVHYDRALAIFERVLGPDHYDLADPLYMIAYAHFELGEIGQARVSFERSLAIELAAGVGGARTAETRLCLAEVAWSLGDREVARTYAEAAWADLQTTEGPEDLVREVDEWIAKHGRSN